MKKNFILLLCIIVLMVVVLASCKHEHTFSDKWYSDDTYHWHPATCKHTETERSDFAPHTDADYNGFCDVCNEEIGHICKFEEAWSSNETHHWHNVLCSHTDSVKLVAHSDEDMNGVCEVCNSHVHKVNSAGYCVHADCGKKVKEIDETSLDELINAIYSQKHLANGGVIDYFANGRSNTGLNRYASKQENVKYDFGKNNYTHIFVDTYSLNEGFNTRLDKDDANGKDPFFGTNGNWQIGDTDTGIKVQVTNAPYLGENETWIIGGVDTKISKAAANGKDPFFGTNGNWQIGDTDTGIKVQVSNAPRIGLDDTWIIGGTEATGTIEYWYEPFDAKNLFGVYSVDGGELQLDYAETAKLNGYSVSLSTFVGEYGVEDTLYALYSIAIGDVNEEEGVTSNTSNLVTMPNVSDNKITFKYTYTHAKINETKVAVGDENIEAGTNIYNVNLFEVEVTFGYTDEYALTSLDIKVDCYTNDPGTDDVYGFLYKDVDIQYNSDTQEITFIEYIKDENGAWVAHPTDKRTPDTYTLSVIQTVEKRTQENPNYKARFDPEGFDLYLERNDDTNELSKKYNGESFEVGIRDTINFYVGECIPSSASLHFAQDKINIKVFQKIVENGVVREIEIDDPQNLTNPIITAKSSSYGEKRDFFVVPKVDGVFRFEIYIEDNRIYSIDIECGAYDEGLVELDKNQFAIKVSQAYSWLNPAEFTAPETGTYYFNVPTGIGFVDRKAYDEAEKAAEDGDTTKYPKPYVDFYDPDYVEGEVHSFSLQLTAGQTVEFYVNSVKRGTYAISYYVFS